MLRHPVGGHEHVGMGICGHGDLLRIEPAKSAKIVDFSS
jgi:hypothetical protein